MKNKSSIEYQREMFRSWQNLGDEICRQWLTSPLFLQSSKFWFDRFLDSCQIFSKTCELYGIDSKPLFQIANQPFFSRNATAFFKNLQSFGVCPPIATTPKETVFQIEDVKLLRYLSNTPKKFSTPILLVSSLVGKPYILDLTPCRSYVSHLLEEGFDVYLIDWQTKDSGNENLDLEDYVLRYLPDIVDTVLKISDSEKLSLLGYSMGGLLALSYTALNAEKVKNLLLLTTPCDFSTKNPIKSWTEKEAFDIERFTDIFGNISADAVSLSFQMVKPVTSLSRGFNILQYLNENKEFQAQMALEYWLHDASPLPASLYKSIIKKFYRENLLAKNKLFIGQKRVDLSNIKCPVFNVIGQLDQVAPPESAKPLKKLIKSVDKKELILPYGHLTIVAGSGAENDFWKKSTTWLAQRSA